MYCKVSLVLIDKCDTVLFWCVQYRKKVTFNFIYNMSQIKTINVFVIFNINTICIVFFFFKTRFSLVLVVEKIFIERIWILNWKV